MKNILDELKTRLEDDSIERSNYSNSGDICGGFGFESSKHGSMYVKICKENYGPTMFEGEFVGLECIKNTNTVLTPKPLLWGKVPLSGDHFLAMEYLDIGGLGPYSAQLGTELALMHLSNKSQKSTKVGNSVDVITQFGFPCSTTCGKFALSNDWSNDWISFYASKRLQPQIEAALPNAGPAKSSMNTNYELLLRKLPSFFSNIEIFPSLVHGDLWIGNAGSAKNRPVIFDPSPVYAHYEYEMGIISMFGGFSNAFFNAYHTKLPKEKGFQERYQLYELFHHLNHWNHFGSGYKSSSLRILESLVSP